MLKIMNFFELFVFRLTRCNRNAEIVAIIVIIIDDIVVVEIVQIAGISG